MALSNSAIKSYNQPSCILQVDHSSNSGKKFSSTFEQLQFELHFDDSRLSKQIGIQGDRHQLAELHEAVTNYVQNLLLSSPERFNTHSSQTNLASQAPLSSYSPSGHTVATDVPENTFNQGRNITPTGEIFLQQGSGISHYLFLGSLATPETGDVIELTMLQLFDLATILDEYAGDVLTTPAFNRPSRAASRPSTTWASIAAMLLLGVGLTAAIVQILNRSDEPQIAQTVTPSPNSNLALKPSPTPQLSSPDTLPQSPTGTSIPLPTASPRSGIPPTTAPLRGTTLPVPTTSTGIPNSLAVPTTKTTPTSSLGAISPQPLPKQPTVPPGSISIPEPTAPEIGKITTLPGINPTANIPSPQPSKISPPTVNNQPSAVDKKVGTATNSNAQPTAQQRLKAALARQNSDPLQLPNTPPTNPTSAKPPTTTAFVNTPQTAEVRDYFAKNWEPPTNLNQTLEYSIVLDVNGSIQRIEPLGKAARTYVDRSGMPLIGEPFVSPNPQGDTPRIRVVLSPDGNVQTFVEPN